MDRCTVTLAETGDLQPLIIGALRSTGVSAAVAGSTNPHPLPVIIRAWSAVEAALEKTLDALDETVKQQDESKGASAALDAYREFLYRAAEFVEAVEKQTRAVAGSYKVPKNLDRILSEQCNAMKHNHMRLGWVSARSGFFRVTGYQMRHHVGDGETSADRFHKKRPSFSFNLEIRRVFAACYLLGEHAGRAIIAVHGAAVPGTGTRSDVLDRVLHLGSLIFPGESKEALPSVVQKGVDIEFTLLGGGMMPLVGQAQITALHTADGFTRTFSLSKI